MLNENKEQATVAYDIAKRSIAVKDFAKALRFLKRIPRMIGEDAAQKSFPDLQSLIDQCNRSISESTQSSNTEPGNQSKRASHGSSTRESSSSSSATEATGHYTKEEAEGVSFIIKNRHDYYKVLSVERTATVEMIRKAYRKCALKYHPDRCHAPQSTEAFKVINAAFACLSDEEKRRLYDQFGTEDTQRIGMQRSSDPFRGMSQRGFFFEDDVLHPDDVFAEMFASMFGPPFGHPGMRRRRRRAAHNGQFDTQHRHQRHRPHHREDPRSHESAGEGSIFFILLPLIFLLVLSFLGQMSSHISHTARSATELLGTRFSFRETRQFSKEMLSQFGGISYHTTPDFHDEINQYSISDRKEWDMFIYKTYVHLARECEKEKERQNKLLERANQMGEGLRKNYLLRQAERMDKPSCRWIEDT